MKTRLLALWRALPIPVRRDAHRLLSGLRGLGDRVSEAAVDVGETLSQRATAHRTAWRARRWGGTAAPRGPVTIAGFLSAVHGLGEGARMLERGFRDCGLPVRAIDLSRDVGFPIDIPSSTPPPSDAERGVVISHINPPELLRWIQATEGRHIYRRRHIGYWAWELETIPDDWRRAFDYVDEVWAPSEFAARAIRAAAPPRVKVTAAPYPVYLNPRPAADRARFGLPADAAVVLMAFDLRSTAERKNPYAALRAFQQAAAMARHEAVLVCKVVGGELYPQTLAELKILTADRPEVRLMTDSLSPEDMAVLTASTDIVLSLHRSEGYGLLMAEAIWHGKAVIATGWSANAEFMDPASSVLADYHLEPVEGDNAIYRLGQWATADEADAAEKLARLIDDDAWRGSLSAATANNRHASFQPRIWADTLRGLLPRPDWIA
ncbi:MAG: glycosyltransferase [Alphaproteobacteria bacterium]|nr:glycosyltransferase [Alphaproteobacteria bacterium]